MKHSVIVIIFTILFTGCAITMTPSQAQVDEKKVPAQTAKHKPWPQEGKEYWYARYFHRMASNPNIRRMLQPEEVFAIIKCTVKQYEEDHSWEWFRKHLTDVQTITPTNTQYIYQTTKVCAAKQKIKSQQPLKGVGDTV